MQNDDKKVINHSLGATPNVVYVNVGALIEHLQEFSSQVEMVVTFDDGYGSGSFTSDGIILKTDGNLHINISS